MSTNDRVAGLLEAARSNQPGGLEALLEYLRPRVLRRAWVVLRDEVEAEDAWVEVVEDLLPRLREIEEPGAFYTYVRRTARSVAVDMLRRRSTRDARRALRGSESVAKRDPTRRTAPIERLPADTTDPEGRLINDERRQRIFEEVERLGEPGRTLLVRCYLGGEPATKVSQDLGLSHSTALRAMRSARSMLAIRLASYLRGEPEGLEVAQ